MIPWTAEIFQAIIPEIMRTTPMIPPVLMLISIMTVTPALLTDHMPTTGGDLQIRLSIFPGWLVPVIATTLLLILMIPIMQVTSGGMPGVWMGQIPLPAQMVNG